MKAIIKPSKINGEITAPPSKSFAQRLMICAFLSGGGVVKNVGFSDDVICIANALKMLGADCEITNNNFVVKNGITTNCTKNPVVNNTVTTRGVDVMDDVTTTGGVVTSAITIRKVKVNCGDSGATLRFLLPIVAALGIDTQFTGSDRLLSRPHSMLIDTLILHGVTVENYHITGNLKGGTFVIDGSVSSQYITGLLFALPLLNKDSEIVIKGEIVSKPYIDMTLSVLKMFGIEVVKTENGFFVPCRQRYITSKNLVVEGDWSGAAVMLSIGALCGEVAVKGLNNNSYQGDKKIVDILKQFGAEVLIDKDKITAKKTKCKLVAKAIDCKDIIDLAQIIAVLAACASGKSIIKNIGNLKYKESDRGTSIIKMLSLVGISAIMCGNDIKIIGGDIMATDFDGDNDHRSVMAQTVLALASNGESVITGVECVKKSYPTFFDDIVKVGGNCNVVV